MSILQSYFLYYFIIFFTTTIVYIYQITRNTKFKKISKFIFWLAVLLPIIISANRYGVGTDYFNYERIYYTVTGFNSIITAIEGTTYEPGWILLNYIVKYIFDDVKYVFVLSSILIWLLNFKSIYHHRSKISIGVSIFILMCTMYNPSFNAIRQYLAASILMFSVRYIGEKQPLRFIISILFAASMHYTALIFAPVYWIINNRNKNVGLIKNIIVLVSPILLIIFSQQLLSFLTEFEAFKRYSYYKLEFSGFGVGNIIIKFPIIIVIILNLKKLKHSQRFIYDLTILYFVGLALEFFGYLADYIGRIALYYEMMQIFVIGSIVKVQENKYEKILYTIGVLIYFIILFTNSIIRLNSHDTVPYIW